MCTMSESQTDPELWIPTNQGWSLLPPVLSNFGQVTHSECQFLYL